MNIRKILLLLLISLAILAGLAVSCGAPPTPTPTPVPPTPIPTSTPTRPATATPTRTITLSVTPTHTPAPPTRPPVIDTPTRAATPTRPRPPAPTGSIVFHTKTDGVNRLFYVDPNSGNVTPFVNLGGGEMDLTLDDFGTNARIGEFSPDGTRFAYVFASAQGKVNVLQVRELSSRLTYALDASDLGISSPTWNADGSRLAFIFRSRQGYSVRIVGVDSSGRPQQIGGRPFVEVKSDELQGAQFRGGISWSRTNLLVLAANKGGESDIYTMFPDTDKSPTTRNITNHASDDSTPVWSPDGRLIVFTSTRDGRPQIYVVNADGSGLRRVSDGQGDDVTPTFSPDGNWISFVSTRDGAGSIYVMDTFGGNIRRLTAGDHAAWSR